MNTENQIILPDGRKLAYAEFGKLDGSPVLYFHGGLSSRLEPLLIGDEVFGRFGLRVIAPDRPGMGQSDFQPDRGFSDWPNDVVFLADALGLRQFAVLGFSAGGGYVAACAAKIPDRLRAAVIVSGAWRMDWPEARNNLSSFNRLVFDLARKAPLLLRLLLKVMGASYKGSRERFLRQLKKHVSASDCAVLEQPDWLDAFLQMSVESVSQGTKGPAWDIGLYVREWDFRLNEIRIPLKLFHGDQDRNVPVALVRRVISVLPNAQLVVYGNEGHLSTFNNHSGQILEALVESP